ncbi:P1 family peptidase [Mangrovactinospora gilvigrisea]|uniref:P1 family peptidase n=1 Tax=Mangrovactinospora gilvigrisea TaxID=1428644 RepID=UPI0009A0FA1A|nr:P1 family peptidase [Mangrovactinospora gilvigrisea]
MRAAELGLAPGPFPSGPRGALTDVPGVRVGHTTLRRPPRVNSGCTAIDAGALPHRPLPAGVFAGNGYGKLIGSTQLAELGQLESPIVLTATLSAFRAADALVDWMLERPDCAAVRSFNPVVGECNDGQLSDIRSRPVGAAQVRAALDAASDGPVAEGCVGAGTGTVALGFKAGIGTASRVAGGHTVGALVQANFDGTLRIGGRTVTPVEQARPAEHGSCMVVLATDAPLDGRQLTRLARRAVYGLARTGAAFSNGSGDYGLAFSVVPVGAGVAPPSEYALSPLFEAVLDAVEESVLNALLAAEDTHGPDGAFAPALPPDAVARP